MVKFIKRGYYYFFYQLYRHFEKCTFVWLSDWKAGMSMIVLEIWLVLSIGIYYTVKQNIKTELSVKMPIVYIPVIIIIIINYFSFFHTDKWKEYIQNFDNSSQVSKRRGAYIVFAIVLGIILNLIFSFYLLSQMNNRKGI